MVQSFFSSSSRLRTSESPRWNLKRLGSFRRTGNPADAVSFTVTGFTTPQTAGVASNITVTALNVSAGTSTKYQDAVRFTSTDPQAVLPSIYSFHLSDAGSHIFSVTLKTAGTQTITVTDTRFATITGSQTGISITAAATSALTVSGFPSPQTAGSAANASITAVDAFGNKTAAYLGTVHLTSTDAQAVLPANYAFTALDAGVHALSVTLKTAPLETITATDTATSTITGSQTGITVAPAAAASMTLAGFPTQASAGSAATATATAKDAYGNIATGYRGTVAWTSNDGAAILPANYTFTALDAGVHTFSITLNTLGSAAAITVTDTASSTITASQTGITVNALASTLVLSGFPTVTPFHIARNVTVTATDSSGNTAAGYLGRVHWTSSDPGAALPADYTYTGTDAGIHVFSLTLNTAGTRNITVTDTITGTITGTQTGITVSTAVGPALGTLMGAMSMTYPANQIPGITIYLTETLGINHQLQVVPIANITTIGFTPVHVTIGGVAQTFQIGSDGSVLIQTALTPYQTIIYALTM